MGALQLCSQMCLGVIVTKKMFYFYFCKMQLTAFLTSVVFLTATLQR